MLSRFHLIPERYGQTDGQICYSTVRAYSVRSLVYRGPFLSGIAFAVAALGWHGRRAKFLSQLRYSCFRDSPFHCQQYADRGNEWLLQASCAVDTGCRTTMLTTTRNPDYVSPRTSRPLMIWKTTVSVRRRKRTFHCWFWSVTIIGHAPVGVIIIVVIIIILMIRLTFCRTVWLQNTNWTMSKNKRRDIISPNWREIKLTERGNPLKRLLSVHPKR